MSHLTIYQRPVLPHSYVQRNAQHRVYFSPQAPYSMTLFSPRPLSLALRASCTGSRSPPPLHQFRVFRGAGRGGGQGSGGLDAMAGQVVGVRVRVTVPGHGPRRPLRHADTPRPKPLRCLYGRLPPPRHRPGPLDLTSSSGRLQMITARHWSREFAKRRSSRCGCSCVIPFLAEHFHFL